MRKLEQEGLVVMIPRRGAVVAEITEKNMRDVLEVRRALEELIIDGVPTNYEFMHLLTYHPSFLKGNYNTGFWEENHKTIEQWLEEGMGDNDH